MRLYDYLSDDEREIASYEAVCDHKFMELDHELSKLMLEHEANMAYIDTKVLLENGTDDDLTQLYMTEAKKLNKKSIGIISSMCGVVIGLFAKVHKWLSNKKVNESENSPSEKEVPASPKQISKAMNDSFSKIGRLLKGVGTAAAIGVVGYNAGKIGYNVYQAKKKTEAAKKKVNDTVNAVVDKATEVKKKAEDTINTAKVAAQDAADKVKTAVKGGADKASYAVEALFGNGSAIPKDGYMRALVDYRKQVVDGEKKLREIKAEIDAKEAAGAPTEIINELKLEFNKLRIAVNTAQKSARILIDNKHGGKSTGVLNGKGRGAEEASKRTGQNKSISDEIKAIQEKYNKLTSATNDRIKSNSGDKKAAATDYYNRLVSLRNSLGTIKTTDPKMRELKLRTRDSIEASIQKAQKMMQ